MRRFTAADYRVMPWKNGGGTTTELYVEPGDDAEFLWRVSIADVVADGPFSIFAGYDRHIMAIEGSGMILDGGPDGPIEVNPKFVPRSFSGDWPIVSELVSGPVRDFNLMARRDRIESGLGCMESSSNFRLGGEPGVTIFAHLLTGVCRIGGGQKLGSGDSLLLKPGESAAASAIEPCRFALCRLKARR